MDNSHSQLSRELLRRVDASPDVRVAYYCNNLQEAHDLIGKEAANGVLYIPDAPQTAGPLTDGGIKAIFDWVVIRQSDLQGHLSNCPDRGDRDQ